MDDQKYIILSILKNFLGEPKSSTDIENREQWEFNCPSETCRNDVNKHNLAYNSEHNVLKCWKCKESGIIHKFVYKYGSKDDYKRLKQILPVYNSNFANIFKKQKINHNLITCPLPDGFIPLNKVISSGMYRQSYDYVTNVRKITPEQIDYFKIGYTEIGDYKNRIIIPSFNGYGNVNYFEARAFLKRMRPTYYKPDKKAFPNKNVPEKYDIIFNEYNINWDLPIFLVEGIFDMIRIPNSIPMLGKTPSWLLISKLIEYGCTIVICVDEDAFKDGMEIYEKLSSLDLEVFFIDLYKKGDVSYVYEKQGNSGIIKLISSKQKIDLSFQLNRMMLKK